MPRYESDVCIIGGGITAAMLALKLSELHRDLHVIVVEAGKRLFDAEKRMAYRQHNIDYAENPWPGDFIQDQAAQGIISRTMAVGGSALHWGGACNRFSEEDLRLKSIFTSIGLSRGPNSKSSTAKPSAAWGSQASQARSRKTAAANPTPCRPCR